MAGPELLLDSSIRLWVVLPIVFITFFVGIIRHYVTQLLQSDKKVDLEQVSDSQVLLRSRILRENGKYIPRQSFAMRKHYFNDAETGFFKTVKRKVVPKNPMTDTSMLTDMMKGNLTNVLPMIVIGGWINWAFSGFVITKVPFPLTLRFKPMLQRGIDLLSLDASWVSSASWYFLNVFGLRSMYSLILGQDNGADDGCCHGDAPRPQQGFQERVGGAGDRGTQVGAGERGGGADFPRSELWKPLQPGRQVRHVLGQRGPLYHRICSEDSENTGHAGCVGKKSSEGSGTQSTQTVELSKLFLF
ncbi:Hypothetical protein SMAX5B_014884 [Scophthalmus maximus]|uniref:ER membrane protein complex subunit 3 n=1 Tax=Scophthalmus maximus TaxID=52904 RepID=A0A2U9C052_SCOMX|nr:Hypothetical protein SMAX5B_014884 [Scophthalmus maximus]